MLVLPVRRMLFPRCVEHLGTIRSDPLVLPYFQSQSFGMGVFSCIILSILDSKDQECQCAVPAKILERGFVGLDLMTSRN